jgi:hypothetical protein
VRARPRNLCNLPLPGLFPQVGDKASRAALPGILPGWKSPAAFAYMPSLDVLAAAAFECFPDQSPQDIASVRLLD